MGILIIVGISSLIWIISDRIYSKNQNKSTLKIQKEFSLKAPLNTVFKSIYYYDNKIFINFEGSKKNKILVFDSDSFIKISEIEIIK